MVGQDKMLQDGIKVNVYDPKGDLVKTQLASKDNPKISFTASSSNGTIYRQWGDTSSACTSQSSSGTCSSSSFT